MLWNAHKVYIPAFPTWYLVTIEICNHAKKFPKLGSWLLKKNTWSHPLLQKEETTSVTLAANRILFFW